MLEKAGIPTALVCTDEFGPLARAESQVLGLGALPLIAIPHPLADNADALVGAKASGVASDIIEALTAAPDVLLAKYEGSFLTQTERRLAGGAVCVDEVCRVDPAIAATKT